MAKRIGIDWDSDEIKSIICSKELTLTEMAEKIGCSIWYLSRKRRRLGHDKILKGGYGHIATNKERKARYNAKIKPFGYKPLKEIKKLSEAAI